MLIIDIEIDTIIQYFNANPWATKSLSKVAWDLYLVPDSKVDRIEKVRSNDMQ